MTQFRAGTARITPNAEPCDRIAIGSVRFSSGNHLKMACAATEAAGPSPAPRMTRQIRSVVKLTVPTIGNCASAQITASTNSTHRVAMRLTMKPTTIAEIENRKKKEEPSRPNCSGSSFRSVVIGTPARPTTILSAKFTSMKRNSREVIFQAPLGVGCAAMIPPRRSLPVGSGGRGCYLRDGREGNRAFCPRLRITITCRHDRDHDLALRPGYAVNSSFGELCCAQHGKWQ